MGSQSSFLQFNGVQQSVAQEPSSSTLRNFDTSQEDDRPIGACEEVKELANFHTFPANWLLMELLTFSFLPTHCPHGTPPGINSTFQCPHVSVFIIYIERTVQYSWVALFVLYWAAAGEYLTFNNESEAQNRRKRGRHVSSIFSFHLNNSSTSHCILLGWLNWWWSISWISSKRPPIEALCFHPILNQLFSIAVPCWLVCLIQHGKRRKSPCPSLN